MKPRINIVSVAVSDLPAALAFYRDGLGWRCWSHPKGAEPLPTASGEAADHAAFELENGLSFVLYARSSLARDAQEPPLPKGSTDFVLTHAVPNREQVESLLAEAEAAGGELVAPPHAQAWGGYSSSFRDLDGHLWEIVWDPDQEELD